MGGFVDNVFGKKKKTNVNMTTTEKASTTPTNPQFVTDAVHGQVRRINDLAGRDPYSFVAGPSELQQQAFAGVKSLGGWQAGTDAAQRMAMQAAGAGSNLAQSSGYTAPTIARAQLGPAIGANVPTLGGPALAAAQGYNPLTMTAEQATAQGYTPFLNTNVAQASAQGYDAAQAVASLVGPAAQAQAVQAQASRAKDFMSDYMNPYTQDVVASTLADFDENAGVLRAQQAAGAARNKAFGGSRYGLQEAQTEGELARARAAAAGALRSDAFKFGAQIGDSDATRLTSTSGINAQLGTQTNQFNTDAINTNNRTNAQLGTQVSLANTGFTNDARQFGANAANTASITNAGFTNQNIWRNQDAFNKQAEFLSNAENIQSLTNTSLRQQANSANMDAGNRAAEFGMNAANQIGLANVGAQNQFGLAQFGANVHAAQNLAAAQNQYGLAGHQGDLQTNLAQGNIDARAAEFGQDALNLNSRFNAGQREAALGRQMQGAGLLGEFANAGAANQRADLGLTAQLGTQQQSLEQMKAQAPLQFEQMVADMMGKQNFGLFNGRDVNSTSNKKGFEITRERDSIFNIGLKLGMMAGGAPPMPIGTGGG